MNEVEEQLAEARLGRHVVRACETVGQFIEYWGFKAIHGRVWTLLALSRNPMTQADMARVLGVSRSLVNGAVAELVDFGLIRATGEHRNAPYVAVLDVWPTIAQVLRTREWMLLENARLALDAALSEARSATDPAWDVERLQALLRMTELAQALLKALLSVRTPRGLASLTGWLRRGAALAAKLGGGRG